MDLLKHLDLLEHQDLLEHHDEENFITEGWLQSAEPVHIVACSLIRKTNLYIDDEVIELSL